MPEWAVNYLIPFALGVLASVVGWFALQNALRPKLSISREISRRKMANNGVQYRIKVKNERRRRAAIDLELDAYLWIPGFYPKRRKTTAIIPLKSNRVLTIAPKSNRLFTLELDAAERRFTAVGKHFDGSSLESMLGNGQVRLFLVATDGYSGYRRAFRAKYSPSSISDRLWKAESLELD